MKRAQRQTEASAGAINKSANLIRASIARFTAGLTVGLFYGFAKEALEYAGSLAEVAQQVGVTARDLQVFRFAAGQVGVSQEQLEVGLTKLTITLGKVAAGASAPIKALNAIGVSANQIKGKDAGEAFRIIADGLEKVTDRSQRAAVEVALFGKSGAALDNLLSGGSAQINGLADAAEKLGIVLSDQQIQRADDTADKLEALKTVLMAQVAGVVADNASAILQLADALATVASESAKALAALRGFYSSALQTAAGFASKHPNIANALFGKGYSGNVRANALHDRLDNFELSRKGGAIKATPAGTDIGQFLATGGGGGRATRRHAGGGASHAAEDLQRQQQDDLRDAKDFSDQQRRAETDILRAKQDLATDYHERNHLSIQMLDLEHEDNEAELAYQVALNTLTKGKEGLTEAQADQLRIAYDTKDGLEREKIAVDDAAETQKRLADLRDHEFDQQRNILESQDAIATTAAERRKIELEILRIAYEQKRQALQHVLDTSRDANELANARGDLATLNATYGNDRQGVMQHTRGPLEEWAASVPQTAAEINEALQSIEVEGLDGLADAIGGVLDGTKSLKSAFHDLAASVLADLIQMTIKMAIFRAISAIGSALGGGGGFAQPSGLASGGNFTGATISGFATGGAFTVLGNSGVDKNVLSLNGLPIANVSHGERVNIGNDNNPNGRMPSPTVNNFDLRGAVMTQDLVDQMNEIGRQSADAGARMGVDRMVDLNTRTFGKALRR